MVMGTLTGRIGSRPILPITTDIVINFDRHGDGICTCKHTLRRAHFSGTYHRMVVYRGHLREEVLTSYFFEWYTGNLPWQDVYLMNVNERVEFVRWWITCTSHEETLLWFWSSSLLFLKFYFCLKTDWLLKRCTPLLQYLIESWIPL